MRWTQHGYELERLAAQAQHCAVLVAPFIKTRALVQVIKSLAPEIPIKCVTRWRLDELACGVSDLGVWDVLAERGNAAVVLVKELHAKYFRFDNAVVIGSCNLTGAAMGYSAHANLELSLTIEASEVTRAFEASLNEIGIVADHETYQHIKQLLADMPVPSFVANVTGSSLECSKQLFEAVDVNGSEIGVPDRYRWLPSCRTPDELFNAYRGRAEELTQGVRAAAISDLTYLDVPIGLDAPAFRAFVSAALLISPSIGKIAAFARTPRRFGEMRNFVANTSDARQPTEAWQTTMRWLLHYFPERFEMHEANFSEVFYSRW
jgi:hypothetical protein